MTLPDTLQRVEKLLRLAAPNSGTSEPERANAALKACALIAEHDLVLRPRNESRPSRLRAPRAQDIVNIVVSAVSRATPYRPALAAEDCDCGVDECSEPIFQGERVWRRIKNGEVEYVHADCWH